MVFSSALGRNGFSMKGHPSSDSSKSLLKADMKITRTSGRTARRCSARPGPFSVGIITSESKRWIVPSWASATSKACLPFCASRTWYPCRVRSVQTKFRTECSSSHTRIVSGGAGAMLELPLQQRKHQTKSQNARYPSRSRIGMISVFAGDPVWAHMRSPSRTGKAGTLPASDGGEHAPPRHCPVPVFDGFHRRDCVFGVLDTAVPIAD
jgi:hypothetical protein